MMKRATLATIALACLAAAPVASARTTKDFTFQGTAPANTSKDFPLTIAKGDTDGTMAVGIRWQNPADDFDLFVFEKFGNDLEQVGSSAGGPPSNTEQTTVQSQGIPLTPGQYVIRVVNFAAVIPSFSGTVKFGPYTPPNKLPTARLKAPKRTRAHHKVTLSAKGSKDPDGKIVSYAFDFNGDGAMDTRPSKRAKVRHRFKAGRHHVTVRVTDDDGAKAFATRTILVYPKK